MWGNQPFAGRNLVYFPLGHIIGPSGTVQKPWNDDFTCEYQQIMVATMVSTWCEMDFVLPQCEILFQNGDLKMGGALCLGLKLPLFKRN